VGDQPLNQRLREVRAAEDAPSAEPAPEPPEPPRRAPLGRLLVSQGVLSQAALDEALERQREDGRPLGQILIELGAISPQNLARALTAQHGVDASGSLRARLGTGESDCKTGEQLAAESFLVRESSDGEPLHRAPSFLDAADVAFELIEERDPDCLEIVRARGGELEHVWSYRRADGPVLPLYPA
jgi:hypothetical protein